MEREKDPKHLRGQKPEPGDDPETALERSGSIDELVPDDPATAGTTEGLIVGAPAAHVPVMGTGLGGRGTGNVERGRARARRRAQGAAGTR